MGRWLTIIDDRLHLNKTINKKLSLYINFDFIILIIFILISYGETRIAIS